MIAPLRASSRISPQAEYYAIRPERTIGLSTFAKPAILQKFHQNEATEVFQMSSLHRYTAAF
jgi:hypothetical protein